MAKEQQRKDPPKNIQRTILAQKCSLWYGNKRCHGCPMAEECQRYTGFLKAMRQARAKRQSGEIAVQRETKKRISHQTAFVPPVNPKYPVSYDGKFIGYLLPLKNIFAYKFVDKNGETHCVNIGQPETDE